jgi:hypothetical protein
LAGFQFPSFFEERLLFKLLLLALLAPATMQVGEGAAEFCGILAPAAAAGCDLNSTRQRSKNLILLFSPIPWARSTAKEAMTSQGPTKKIVFFFFFSFILVRQPPPTKTKWGLSGSPPLFVVNSSQSRGGANLLTSFSKQREGEKEKVGAVSVAIGIHHIESQEEEASIPPLSFPPPHRSDKQD